MDIIISGYGRMGKEVEKVCLKKNHNIIARLDNENDWTNLPKDINSAVIIDFSLPDIVTSNITKAFTLKIPIVTGTTGWHDQLERITEECKKEYGTLFYAPNFSIGVNVFLRTNAYLSRIMSKVDGYSVKIDETHHIHKLDAPSGTAIATADVVIENNDKILGWSLDKVEEDTIPIYATREGEVTGNHAVTYESDVDKLILSHKAKNRSGFALGAVLAAEFVSNKKGVFTMDDLLNDLG